MTGSTTNGGGAGDLEVSDDTVTVVEPPDNKIAWGVFGWWLIILIGTLIGGYLVAPEVPNSRFVSAAAVLTFVTTAAVGIERIIEGGFAVLGQSSGFGGWWPLKQVSGAIKTFEQNTNAYVSTPLADAITELESLKNAAVDAGDLTEQARAQVEARIAAYARTRDELQARLDNLSKLAPGSPRFERANELADKASKTMNEIAETASTISGQLGDEVLKAADTIAGAANRAGDIVASFSDNPARKVLSLMVGSIVGIAVASFMGLNLFLAVLDDPADAPAAPAADAPTGTDTGICDGGAAACLDGRAGILVTGMLIGFGSSPTHEVIKALQRRRRNGDDDDDDASDAVGAGGQALNILGVTAPGAEPRAATPIRRRHVRSTD